jgi:hypothetical protein
MFGSFAFLGSFDGLGPRAIWIGAEAVDGDDPATESARCAGRRRNGNELELSIVSV